VGAEGTILKKKEGRKGTLQLPMKGGALSSPDLRQLILLEAQKLVADDKRADVDTLSEHVEAFRRLQGRGSPPQLRPSPSEGDDSAEEQQGGELSWEASPAVALKKPAFRHEEGDLDPFLRRDEGESPRDDFSFSLPLAEPPGAAIKTKM
jgi:hypothetical protein